MSKTLYKVQIGAFSVKANAQKMAEKLKKAGLPASIVTVDGLMKVQCGAFSVKANAEKRLAEVKKKGFLNAILVTVPGTDEEKPQPTTDWSKVLAVLEEIMAAKDPHQAVIDILKECGHTLKPSSAWCSETVVAAFLKAGLGELIGGYSADAQSLKAKAKQLGIWHDGSSGIVAGDIILYGSGTPNHTEIAIDGTYNISGNYGGTVKKRKRAGRSIAGYIRPMYSVIEKETVRNRIRIHPVWFFEKDEAKYGDCTAIYEYAADGSVAHCILIDTAMSGASSVVISKLKAQGVKSIDAIVISHGHGDHYGGVSNIMKAFSVGCIYIPDCAGLDKYQKSYAKALRNQAAKAKKSVTLKTGSSFQVGNIVCRCIYQAPAQSLKEHDDHHFVNNQSVVLRFDCNGWIFHTAGDLQNEGNNLLISAVSDLKADIFKVQWHGDANATNEAICKAVRPLVAFSNYHHKEQSGRGTTRQKLEAVGAVVARNHENGDIYIDLEVGKMTLSCSKKNLQKEWRHEV